MPSNGLTFSDLLESAKALGEDHGKGRDTQVKFTLKVIEGGYHRALDVTPNKHGPDKDDAAVLAEAYWKAQQGSVIFDAKAPNQRKTISCLRTGIKLGMWNKGGNGEPLATVNNLLSMRQKLRKIPGEVKKLDDANNALLKFARAQIKLDTLIPDSDLTDFLYKADPGFQTPEQIIEQIVKKLDSLVTGAAAHNTAQDASPEVIDARDKLRKRLAAIAKARGAPATTP